jgi:simple sugar transport system permease protein
VIDLLLVGAFLEAAVRVGVPLALAALGEAVTERSGVINIGVEGSIIAGALAGALAALGTDSAAVGVLAGGLVGAGVALLFAAFTVGLGANQIIAGTAVTLAGYGFTSVVYETRFGATGTQLTLPTLDPLALPLLSRIPLVGTAFFAQPATAYFAYLLAPGLWWFLFRTGPGLSLRAVGEAPGAAAAAGQRVRGIRFLATLWGGLLAGIAGAHLALAYAGTFQAGMSAGRGFIAIAVVVLGRWNPLWVLAAALFFGAAWALEISLQTLQLDVPYPLFHALPYLLTLAALGGWVGRARAPAALAESWPASES